MKRYAGVFIGTGAAVRIALGFRPQRVRITNLDEAATPWIEWDDRYAAGVIQPEGLKIIENTKLARTALTFGQGVAPYYGGDRISSAAVGYQMPTHAVALYQGDQRQAGTLGIVDGWTLGNSGNRTGNFNRGVNTTYVGRGSKVLIKGNTEQESKWYTIQAITSDGDGANQVTLSGPAPSGVVEKILYMAEFAPAPAGIVMPPGILLSETADVNVSGEYCLLEAWMHEED